MDKSNSIDLNTVIQRNEVKFLANRLGEEMVMMNMETGDFVTLNNVGADIWTIADQPMPVKDLVKKLQEIYDISDEQCLAETREFLLSTRDENIFVFHNTTSN